MQSTQVSNHQLCCCRKKWHAEYTSFKSPGLLLQEKNDMQSTQVSNHQLCCCSKKWHAEYTSFKSPACAYWCVSSQFPHPTPTTLSRGALKGGATLLQHHVGNSALDAWEQMLVLPRSKQIKARCDKKTM
jgi:hypothetical protein